MFSSPFTFLRRTSSQYEAALWMFLSGILFTAHVALGKLLSGSYEPGLLAFYRSVIALVWVAPLLMRMPLSKFKTKHAGLIVIRSLFGTAGFLLAFYAYSQEFGIPLSQFNAISFSRSLFIVILAYFLLKEQVGPRRWMATAIGFIGVLIMVRPSADMEIGSILALGSALCFGGAIILVKTLSRFHSPLVLLTYANLLSAILTLPVAIMQWENPHNLADVGLIGLMALAGLLAQSCYITGMSKGDASFLSTIDYLRLPMTAVVDWLIFQEFPGPLIWLGAAIIVASTLYITIREAASSPKPASTVPSD
ncbi:DMT family transporter [Ponticaulis koreensis]|uniref:DMT family transporter n=1 Tax=Ponticaulis koreensis TaxID=1123045 RepID=UPI0003B533BA|nr:DMT family transporter [Ponticaulis koreensis]